MIPVRLGEIDSGRLVRGDPGLPITGVVSDSRLARPGALFACLRGSRCDGHQFVSDAAARGAVAALCEPGRGGGVAELAVLGAQSVIQPSGWATGENGPLHSPQLREFLLPASCSPTWR